MISSPIARRSCLALLAGLTALLAACGGGGDSGGGGDASIRVLNATSDLPSIDVYVGDGKTFPANNVDTLSAYTTVGAASYDIKITSAGNTTTLLTGAYNLSGGQHYTGVVWGRNGSLRFITLPEDENTDNITTGNSRLRVYNATSDVGTLDVYLTQNIDDLANASPISAAVTSTSLGAFRELSAGSYRLRVTGAGDNADVRLDVPVLTLESKQFATLIVTAGPGGVLVNGAALVQQGTGITQLKNTQARMRVVAGADARGSVTVQLDGSTLAGALRSPTVGPYTLVSAGTRSVDVLLNGSSISLANRVLAPGGDYTLMAYSNAGAGAVQLLSDDNRLPAAGRYRVRLVNAATVEPLTLSVDFAALISNVTLGVGSAFVTGTTNASARVDVTSTSGIDSLFSSEDVNLQSIGVYTVFMLGGNSDAVTGLAKPTGVLRKDR